VDGDRQPQDLPQHEPPPEGAVTLAGAAQPGSIDCGKCGVVMPAGSRYCLGCGGQLDVPAARQEPMKAPPATPAVPLAPPPVAPGPAPFTTGPGVGTTGSRTFAFAPERRSPAEWVRTPWVIIAAVVVAVGVIATLTTRDDGAEDGGSSASPAPTSFHLTGTLSAPTCDGGYNIEYANIYVRNQSDELIGSGTTTGNTSSGFGCEVSFGIDVPRASFYTLRIGSHDGPAYSFEEMTANGWSLSLSLGD
jgi:hypothetical protein